MGVNKPRGYIPGDRLVECEVCGFGYRHSRIRVGVMPRQKGLYVCPTCYDAWHPNEGWKLPQKAEGAVSPGPIGESEILLTPCCTEDTITLSATSESNLARLPFGEDDLIVLLAASDESWSAVIPLRLIGGFE